MDGIHGPMVLATITRDSEKKVIASITCQAVIRESAAITSRRIETRISLH